MYIYIYIYTHTYIHTYIYLHVYIYTHGRIEDECRATDSDLLGGAQDVPQEREDELRTQFLKRLHDQ